MYFYQTQLDATTHMWYKTCYTRHTYDSHWRILVNGLYGIPSIWLILNIKLRMCSFTSSTLNQQLLHDIELVCHVTHTVLVESDTWYIWNIKPVICTSHSYCSKVYGKGLYCIVSQQLTHIKHKACTFTRYSLKRQLICDIKLTKLDTLLIAMGYMVCQTSGSSKT